MELQKAIENGYVLVAKDNMNEFYSNINSDHNSKKGNEGCLIQYVNGEFCGLFYVTKDLIKQLYDNMK